GTLRQAILDSDAAPTPDFIQFDPSLFTSGPKTINLASALPSITDDLTVTGPGSGLLSLGSGMIQVADNPFRTVEVTGLTLGGIYAGTGSFTLLDSMVRGGSGIQVGGGGFLTVKRSTITGAKSTGSGGGIAFAGNNSIGGSLDLEDSTIAGNSAAGIGGGIFFYGNVGAGGFTISNSTIVGNTGGTFGGGIGTSYAHGTFVIRNSTITGNTAINPNGSNRYGGGGLGVDYPGPTTFVIQSSIIALNTATNGPDVLVDGGYGSFVTTVDHSLIGVQPTGTFSSVGWANNLIGNLGFPADPKLAPLGNYGGPTQTMALLAGSPALNAGSNPGNVATDQRGVPRTIGPAPDIGAYEYQPITVANVQVNDGSLQRSEVKSITVSFSGPVSFANGNAAAAFQLTHVQTGNNVVLSAAISTDSQGRTVVTLGFSGSETDPVSALNGGTASLADGRYQLTILGAAVSDAALGWALDGNADGTPGGNYVSPTDTYHGPGLHLYRLFGDVNGDGVVDASDLGLLRSTFNANQSQANYLAYLDADNSGAVDVGDLGQFRSRFNANVF
ncbi:MAG TPA: choice-of-anchor Q domain-containing protein, partial [Gemmataceae bacterium]|nr:choice-of-anchor Q domain-containing protein [Gemmataceae bacterium]